MLHGHGGARQQQQQQLPAAEDDATAPADQELAPLLIDREDPGEGGPPPGCALASKPRGRAGGP